LIDPLSFLFTGEPGFLPAKRAKINKLHATISGVNAARQKQSGWDLLYFLATDPRAKSDTAGHFDQGLLANCSVCA
jgi:hypothetical protein